MFEKLSSKYFARRCPECSGSVYRHLNTSNKLAMFLPFPSSWKVDYQCEDCRTFFSGHSLPSDWILFGAFSGALVYSHFNLWAALIVLATWIYVTAWETHKGPLGVGHTLLSTILISFYWMATMYFNGHKLFSLLDDQIKMLEAVIVITLLAGAILGIILLGIDRLVPLGLKEKVEG